MRTRKSQKIVFGSGLVGAVAGTVAIAAYFFVIRPRCLRWGATDEEVNRRLPGDDLVPDPKVYATHAITVNAPAAQVWPWLVQLGQGRGGFYSYDWLENLMGLDIHTADRILPEHQDLKVGDVIRLAPDGFGVPLAILEPGWALVMHGDTRTAQPGEIPTMRPGDYLNVTWGLFLDDLGDRRSRLIERWKANWNPSLFNTLFYRFFLEPGAFLMERKMLLGIKERAEAINVS